MLWIVIILGTVIAFLAVSLYQSGALSEGPGALITIAALAAFDLLIYLAERAQRRRLARLGGALDEGTARLRVGLFTRRRVEGRFRGRAAKLMIESRGKGRPACVIAQLACSSTFRFRFYRTTATIRIGTARNSFQVNDAQIDREFIFVSQDPDRARNWLLKPENKEKVLAMLRRGRGSSLVLKQGFLTWNISNFFNAISYREFDSGHRFKMKDASKIADVERTAVREALDSLTQLVASLEKSA
jgi:hypothetical protein